MNIQVKQLTKIYDGRNVLDYVDAAFAEHEITCLMGASGYGKTTLLHCLMGMVQPDEGVVEGMPDKFSAVFQEDRLCMDFTAYSNIKLVCREGVKRYEIEQHLKEVGLNDSMYQPVKELSGGMKRRVAIVRAVMAEGGLIMLDEPFKGMDVNTKEQIIAYLKKYRNNRTVLLVTHDEEDVALLGGTLYLL